jgi:hypothetical protein
VDNLSDNSIASKNGGSIGNMTSKKKTVGIPFLTDDNGFKIFVDYGKCSYCILIILHLS